MAENIFVHWKIADKIHVLEELIHGLYAAIDWPCNGRIFNINGPIWSCVTKHGFVQGDVSENVDACIRDEPQATLQGSIDSARLFVPFLICR